MGSAVLLWTNSKKNNVGPPERGSGLLSGTQCFGSEASVKVSGSQVDSLFLTSQMQRFWQRGFQSKGPFETYMRTYVHMWTHVVLFFKCATLQKSLLITPVQQQKWWKVVLFLRLFTYVQPRIPYKYFHHAQYPGSCYVQHFYNLFI